MLQFTLVFVASLAVCIAIAYIFINKGEVLVGAVLGLLPLGIVEVAYNLYLSAQIQRCMERACASSSLPPGCTVGDFGCNEWSGLARALFLIAGLLCLILYAVIVAIVAYLVMRKQHKAAGLNTASRGPESDQSML